MLPTQSFAQRGIPSSNSPANFNARNGTRSFPRHARSGRNAYPYGLRYPGYASLPFSFFGDSFDPNDIYSTGYPVASAPPPYLMQALQGLANPAASSMSALMTPPSRSNDSSGPLLIELQNGRYVHVSGPEYSADAEPITFRESAAKAKTKPAQQAQESPQPRVAAPLLPVTLIFRDGHREEVRDYSIAQGVLYARGDYYTDGYWNKRIDLAVLNMPATLEINAAHNVKFTLPTSPIEVVTRP